MNTKEILKKFWFVILVAVLFIVFIGAYAVNSIANRPTTKEAKQVDGKYVIYSINGENYYADELYDSLKTNFGLPTIYREFDRLVCDKAIETTNEMKNIATSNAQYLLSYYGEAELTNQMKKLGYNDANDAYDYYIDLLKSMQLRTDFLKANESTYVTPFVTENNPKVISHILIKVADIEKVEAEDGKVTYNAKPTAEEQTKLDEVLKALETEDFATVAKKYSEDGSAQDGGMLGYFDNKNTTYVPEFKEVATKTHEGQTSEVFTSQFGYHIIYCNTEKLEDLYNYNEFLNGIFGTDQALYNKPLVEKAKELNITINDENLSKLLYETITESEGAK